MPSALFSSNYSATANNILNKFDNSPIYDSATGAWTFKDNAGNSLISATTSAISLNKATTVSDSDNASPFTLQGSNARLYLESSGATQGQIVARNNIVIYTNNANTAVQGLAIDTAGAVTLGAVNTNVHKFFGGYEHAISSGVTARYIVAASNTGSFTVDDYRRANGGQAGAITCDLTALTTNFYNPSDERRKLDVGSFSGLSLVLATTPRKFKWRHAENSPAEIGFFAQEMQELVPWAVREGGEDPMTEPWMLDYNKLVAVSYKAIQELASKMDACDAVISELSAKLDEAYAEIAALKSA